MAQYLPAYQYLHLLHYHSHRYYTANILYSKLTVESTDNVPQPRPKIPENFVTIILDVYAKQYTLIMSGLTTILTKD